MDDRSRLAALSELRGVLRASGTAEPDEGLLTSLLEIEGWDVRRAAKMIQDDSTAERRRSGADDEEIARSFAQPSSQMERFEVDDSQTSLAFEGNERGLGSFYEFRSTRRHPGSVGLSGDRAGPLGDRPSGLTISSLIWSAITFPLSLAQSILFLLARIFRLRSLFPGLFGGASGGVGRPKRPRTDPRICAERFIQELEEETGGASSAGAASLGLAENGSERGLIDGENDKPVQMLPRPKLPPFHVGGYAEALKLAKEQIKILMVVLTSREHSDMDHFRRRTLLDDDLVGLVSGPDFVVWGGDVRELEAYQVASQLHATTYPFVAFIALQPSRASRRHGYSQSLASASTPRQAIISRLEGSPLSATSAQTISSHITGVVLPRTQSFLDRLRRERRRRDIERELKAEQDRAYEEASRRDAERVAKKREEEQRRVLEMEKARREQEEQEAEARKRTTWLAWARHYLVPDEPSAGEETIRLAFRLPSGKTLSRAFRASDQLEAVFAFVDTHAADPQFLGETASKPPTGYEHEFAFSLVLGYPRRRIDPAELKAVGANGSGRKTIGDIDGLSSSASLIVEGKVGLCRDDDEESSDSDGSDD